MLSIPSVSVDVAWRAAAPRDPVLREAIVAELRRLAWTLSQMEALVDDAHRVAGIEDAWLLPRLELKLPLFDHGKRYRLVLTCIDHPRATLLDDADRRVADVRVV